MAEWIGNIDLDGMDPDFISIRSLFLSGSISKMYQLVKHSPTKVSKLLGLNYDAYHTKLVQPEKFSILHINVLAYAVKIDPMIIFEIIQKETSSRVREKYQKFSGGAKKEVK